MCVQDVSLGVDICLRARWLSSGFTVSIIMWMLGWSSVDITHALTTQGTAESPSCRHVVHANRSFSLHDLKLRRLRIADQPATWITRKNCIFLTRVLYNFEIREQCNLLQRQQLHGMITDPNSTLSTLGLNQLGRVQWCCQPIKICATYPRMFSSGTRGRNW